MSTEDLNTDSCGVTLAQARQAAAVSQRDVAEALHLPVQVVDAIERGDKARLPAHVFTRGYVRAYAKLLELDPEPLVTALSFEYGATEEERSPVVGALASPGVFIAQDTSLHRPHPLVQVFVVGLAIVGVGVLLILLLAYYNEEDMAVPVLETSLQSDLQTDRQTGLGTGPGTKEDAQVAPQTERAALPPETATTTAAADIQAPASTPVATEEPDATDVAQPPAPPAGDTEEELQNAVPAGNSADGAVQRLTAEGEDRLTLQFTADCWVEIKDNADNLLYSDLGQSGQLLEFVGAGPFGVKLGYASGVIMLYNDEPVTLTAHTRNNIANLVIGQ